MFVIRIGLFLNEIIKSSKIIKDESLCFHLSLLKDHTSKSSYFHNKINSAPDTRNLFRTLNSLLCPPPTSSIIADDFATFFTEKTRTISSQFSPPHIQDLQSTTSTTQTPIFSFGPLTEAEVSKFLLSSHPTTCPLYPIPSHLLQAITPTLLSTLTHIINTSYCNVLLAWLPSSTIKPLTIIQNAVARGKKSPCYTSLYLLALATGCSSYLVQNIDACI